MAHSHTGYERIIDICHERGCDSYINAIGGAELYDKDVFAEKGIKLSFLEMDPDITYPQGKGDFIPGLSIMDVMMYNSKEEIAQLLTRFRVVE